ncbi:hypothetical protein [Paractinoplanes atraurantiacus]|uniref:hypothetical protein n=1 Tax=Paractinoplanes atraurantiacus TaxID=1036182 RepID=UPI000BE3B61B|nr:hypothetical protein [Actinoplanes atraurantiacus]
MSPVDPLILDFGGVEGGGRIANVHVRKAAHAARNIVLTLHDEGSDGDADDDQIGLFLVFLYPGIVWAPEHQGMRVDRWVKRDRRMVIQVAVDDGVVLDAGEARAYVAQNLRAAGLLLDAEVSKRGIPGSTATCHRLIEAVLASEEWAGLQHG